MVVTFASRACGGRGSVRVREAWAGRIALREPKASFRRAALLGFVSSSGRRQRAQRRRNRWRNGEPCVRQNRLVLAVVATVKLLRMRHARQPARCRRLSRGRGRPAGTRLPGEHGISRPTIAQGRPSDWLHLYAAVRFSCVCFRAADRGCQPAPGLPCALLDKRVERRSKARAKRAARLRSRVCKSKCELEERHCRLILRHCERSEAIQSAAAEGFWIASLRRCGESVRHTRSGAPDARSKRQAPLARVGDAVGDAEGADSPGGPLSAPK
ncbi:hypothetical protein ABIC03_003342 [Bradyrhizobium sp. RT6a]